MTPWVDVALAAVAMVAAGVPALLFARNLGRFRPPPAAAPRAAGEAAPAVSVLVPARNEEATLGGALAAILASRGVELEVIVLDDASEDATAEVAAGLAAGDPRLRVEPAPPLPAGWSGKQHACWRLAGLARHRRLAFVDADVRLAPDALARAVAFQDACGAPLVSGFPRQITETPVERLLLPLIHWLLLGFLPIGRMRRRLDPPTAPAGRG
jgi:glycosyltransferase involved in cell wall biosynthesis